MSSIGYGPLWTIPGPPPEQPLFSLLKAARVVPDADAGGIERWGNGVQVYPYPPGPAHVQDACSTGSDREKDTGETVPLPQFAAMIVYLAETCSSLGIYGAGLSNAEAQDRFTARAMSALQSVESGALERELLAGDVLGLNPFLADGNGTFPESDTAVSVVEGFGALENEIAAGGGRGMIHVSPRMATAATSNFLLDGDDRSGQLVTINGTVVVPGQGYIDDTVHPVGHAAASTDQEWIYATGPVEIRRGATELLPGTVGEALDRGDNTITYRVERTYVVDWDTVVQAAVLVDRTP